MDGMACTDGDNTTANDACQAGVCVGRPYTCDDGNLCTDDACDPGAGCVYANNDLPCSDGSKCTTDDICSGGSCTPGAPLNCQDGGLCTTTTCDPAVGCVTTPVAPCCGNNIVEGGENCDDGNNNDGDGCAANCVNPTQKCSEVAIAHCKAKGWQHVGEWPGDIVCTQNGQGTGSNCDTCSTYHIYVWKNGAGDGHCPGAYSTTAGNFYSAHTPCTCGDNLDLCGSWDMQGCIPD